MAGVSKLNSAHPLKLCKYIYWYPVKLLENITYAP